MRSFAIVLLAATAQAAIHDGHENTIRPGAELTGLTGRAATASAATAKDCFDACMANKRCSAWNFASAGCAGGRSCALKSDDLLAEPVAATPGCNRTSGSRAAVEGLIPLKFKPLSLRDVTPAGWLRAQLVTMANGLSGHLDHFWADVNESVWIGGKADHGGAGHERGPYWLNGMVPLNAQLNNTGDAGSSAVHVDLTDQVNSWINYILDHQLPSGWLGPDDGFGGKGNDYWSGWNTAASLLQYADAAGVFTPVGKRSGAAVLAYIKCIYTRMHTVPTTAWTQNRWQDWVYIIHWALDQDPQGMEQMLWDAAALTQAQSWDWDAYYNRAGVGTTGAYKGKPMPKFPLANVTHWDMYDHGVNNAMGTKSCSTWYRQSKDKAAVAQAYHKLQMQDTWQGQPHGMFSADECFGGRGLNRGIELCAVVEQMYSLQHMFRVHGDPSFLDRCERIAYNSLPGTITADMWQHQYLQQANEITALYGQTHHPWQTDGPDSTGFGVAPNFGCCTANMQQGWPKQAANVLMADPGGGFLVAMYAPVKYKAGGVTVEVTTDYPFGDDVVIEVTGPATTAIPVSVRIPGWADKATIATAAAGPKKPAANGTIVKTECKGRCTITIELNPEVRFEYGWGEHASNSSGATNALSVLRGPLLYSLPLKEITKVVKTWAPFNNTDVDLTTTTAWNWVVDVAKAPVYTKVGTPASPHPFGNKYPSTIAITAMPLASWNETMQAADEPEPSPVKCGLLSAGAGPAHCGKPAELTLVPYGATNLRMSAMPWTNSTK